MGQRCLCENMVNGNVCPNVTLIENTLGGKIWHTVFIAALYKKA